MAPRIGPVSDYYGVILPPKDNTCSGLISTFPALPTFIAKHSWTVSGTIGSYSKQAIGSSGVIDTDTSGFNDAADNAFKIPSGLAGYYSLKIDIQWNVAHTGSGLLTLHVQLRINGVAFAPEWVHVFSGTDTTTHTVLNIPIFSAGVGDLITIWNGAFSSGGSWIYFPLAGSTWTIEMDYLGS